MILNTYAVLAAFVALMQLLLGLLVLVLGAYHRAGSTGDRGEQRSHLAYLLTWHLIGLSLVSWPLMFLLLQSYVSEWEGVMCIYGVTRVGAGSLGPARHLPDLLQALHLTKPALVFAGGAWYGLYVLNRRTRTAPLTRRLFLLLMPLGLLAMVDAALELTYVAIPKKEEFPSGGCCTVTASAIDEPGLLPTHLGGDAVRGWLYAGYYGANAAMILALGFAVWRRTLPDSRILVPLILGSALTFATSTCFLNEVAAPRLLELPHHHCAYDLISDVPEAIVAMAFFLGANFLLGWAGVLRWFGAFAETEPFLANAVRELLRLSVWGYTASIVMLTLELALA